jgi:methylase of polypeptide subunit release factors
MFGTGSGTQTIQLSKSGLDITRTDLSENAVKGNKTYPNKVNLVVENILNSKIKEKESEYTFERLLSYLPIEERQKYIKN